MRLLAVILIICAVSCKKDKKHNDLQACLLEEQNLDSAELASRLAGSWKLTGQHCPLGSNPVDDVNVTFNPAGTFNLQKNDSTILQGTWSFVKASGDSWSLHTSEQSFYFLGDIKFCGQRLVFFAIHFDGCNHIFKKNS